MFKVVLAVALELFLSPSMAIAQHDGHGGFHGGPGGFHGGPGGGWHGPGGWHGGGGYNPGGWHGGGYYRPGYERRDPGIVGGLFGALGAVVGGVIDGAEDVALGGRYYGGQYYAPGVGQCWSWDATSGWIWVCGQ